MIYLLILRGMKACVFDATAKRAGPVGGGGAVYIVACQQLHGNPWQLSKRSWLNLGAFGSLKRVSGVTWCEFHLFPSPSDWASKKKKKKSNLSGDQACFPVSRSQMPPPPP